MSTKNEKIINYFDSMNMTSKSETKRMTKSVPKMVETLLDDDEFLAVKNDKVYTVKLFHSYKLSSYYKGQNTPWYDVIPSEFIWKVEISELDCTNVQDCINRIYDLPKVLKTTCFNWNTKEKLLDLLKEQVTEGMQMVLV